jgi:hypothetical protein
MKPVSAFLALFVAGLAAASFAAAGPPPGKGKGKHDSTSGSTTSASPVPCRPIVSAILKGTFVSAGGTDFTMNVTHANRHGRAAALLHGMTGMRIISVDAKTSFKRNGPATLADFVSGDRLNVQARVCKAPKGAETPTNGPVQVQPIVAKRVVGHPA